MPSPPTPLPEYRERGANMPSPPTPLPEYRERGVNMPSPPTLLPEYRERRANMPSPPTPLPEYRERGAGVSFSNTPIGADSQSFRIAVARLGCEPARRCCGLGRPLPSKGKTAAPCQRGRAGVRVVACLHPRMEIRADEHPAPCRCHRSPGRDRRGAAGAGGHRRRSELLQTSDEADVVRSAPNADVLLVYHDIKLGEHSIAQLPRCKGIIRCGVGFDNVDLQAAGSHGIVVCNVPDYGTEEVADHAMLLLLALARRLLPCDQAIRAGAWDLTHVFGTPRLRGRTLGLIGCGRIGTAMALRAPCPGHARGLLRSLPARRPGESARRRALLRPGGTAAAVRTSSACTAR